MPVFCTSGSLAEFRQGYVPPNAVSNVTITRNDGYDITVNYTPAPILPPNLPQNYVAIASPGSFSNTSTGNSILLQKLDPLVTYNATVYANNIAGCSQPSTSSPYYMSSNLVANGNISIANTTGITISPAGTEVDVITSTGRLLRYTRNTSTGQLTLLANVNVGNTYLTSVDTSADGNFIYMYGKNTSTDLQVIYSFSKSNSAIVTTGNPGANVFSGNLGVQTLGLDCKLVTTPDNKSVIATGYIGSFGNRVPHIINYSRNTTTGNLTLYQSAFQPILSNGAVNPNTEIVRVCVPFDSKNLYIGIWNTSSVSASDISIYTRNTSNTNLTHLSTTSLFSNAGGQLHNVFASFDGTSIYGSQSIYVYNYQRNTSTGSISLVGNVNAGQFIVAGLSVANTILLGSGSNATFQRDTSTGALTHFSNSASFGVTSEVVYSSDNKNVYAVSGSGLTIYNISA
jgi:hypothetical protein